MGILIFFTSKDAGKNKHLIGVRVKQKLEQLRPDSSGGSLNAGTIVMRVSRKAEKLKGCLFWG